jgi:hypothetical protein
LDENRTIAIDPGLKLKNLPLQQLDANINLIFLYDLSRHPNGEGYIKGFISTLDKYEKDMIREINTPIPTEAIVYFNLRTAILDTLLGRKTTRFYKIYSPENTLRINDLLKR